MKPNEPDEPKKTRTIEQRIADAQDKLNRLRAAERTKDTRQKIIVGAAVITDAMEDQGKAGKATSLLKLLEDKIKRDIDKKDLAPLLEKLRKISGGEK